jgi:hypothetical protein
MRRDKGAPRNTRNTRTGFFRVVRVVRGLKWMPLLTELGIFFGTETTNMPRLRRSLRAMKLKAQVIVPEYQQVVEI